MEPNPVRMEMQQTLSESWDPLNQQAMKIIKTGNKTWENRHETFVENIKDLYELGNEDNLDALNSYNDATKDLQGLIKDAIDTQTPLRSLGAGWSWTKAGRTR